MCKKKIVAGLILSVIGTTQLLSNYTYCKTFDGSKKTFYFTGVFHSKEYDDHISLFTDTYNKYPGEDYNCFDFYESKNWI